MAATLDWMGCATFRLTLGDMVVLLDAYIDRVPSATPTGITVDAIHTADWIVVGHSHFDHLYGAERIAKATGAKIIGSYESIRIMAAQGVPEEQLLPVAGGEKIRLSPDISVDVYPSQHSCVWSTEPLPESDAVCIGELGVTYQEQQEKMEGLWDQLKAMGDDVVSHLQASAQGARGDGGALVYFFDTPEGSLLYQDTSGHWQGILQDIRPDVAILAAAGRGNIDGEPIQGTLAQFVAQQVSLLHPRRVILGHHDDWLPGFSRQIDTAPIREEMARRAPRTELVEMGYMEAYPVFGAR